MSGVPFNLLPPEDPLTIFVKTVGTLKNLEEGTKSFTLDLPEQTSVSRVMEHLKLKNWEIGFILINGKRSTMESILQDQDQLTLVAPLAGG